MRVVCWTSVTFTAKCAVGLSCSLMMGIECVTLPTVLTRVYAPAPCMCTPHIQGVYNMRAQHVPLHTTITQTDISRNTSTLYSEPVPRVVAHPCLRLMSHAAATKAAERDDGDINVPFKGWAVPTDGTAAGTADDGSRQVNIRPLAIPGHRRK